MDENRAAFAELWGSKTIGNNPERFKVETQLEISLLMNEIVDHIENKTKKGSSYKFV